jgi:hypothetical protein
LSDFRNNAQHKKPNCTNLYKFVQICTQRKHIDTFPLLSLSFQQISFWLVNRYIFMLPMLKKIIFFCCTNVLYFYRLFFPNRSHFCLLNCNKSTKTNGNRILFSKLKTQINQSAFECMIIHIIHDYIFYFSISIGGFRSKWKTVWHTYPVVIFAQEIGKTKFVIYV